MRQRKIKEIEKKIAAFEQYIVREAEDQKGKWIECFSREAQRSNMELFTEIGCGKGNFITKQACLNPEKCFIGFEGNETVIYRALQKIDSLEKDNPEATSRIKLCPSFIYDPVDIFSECELAGIYLNFSDPWPKAKHEKRRLTQPLFIKGYCHILKESGALELKTDNENFFNYSVSNIKNEKGFEIEAIVEDLHRSEYNERNVETEYEYKFINLKRKIKFIRAIKK